MSDWKEYKIGELLILEYGKSLTDYRNSQGEYEVFGTNGKIGTTDKFIYNEPSLIIGRKGAYREVHFSPKPFFVIDTAFYTKKKNNLTNTLFMYYWFKNVDINAMDSGSAIPSTSRDEVYDIDISLPSLKIQAEIADILSSLDDKIDLLHRQNKTLEQLAETLFRQWFLTDQKSNELTELENYVEIINGVSYKSSELNPSETAMVSLKSFDRNGGFRIDGFKEFTGKYKPQQVVNEGDLIVAHTDITQDAEVIGNPAIVIGNSKYSTMVISMDMVKVVPKIDWMSIEFLYYLMRTREFKGHCEGNSNGSTVLHLSKRAIPTFEFQKPNKEKVVEFTSQTKELNSKYFNNYRQIKNLTQLRDNLLPKLMSGEVMVDD